MALSKEEMLALLSGTQQYKRSIRKQKLDQKKRESAKRIEENS